MICNLLMTLMKSFFDLTGDWGMAIMMVTLLIRTLLLPVSFKQKSAMEAQQEIAKKMEELKVKFKSDKAKLEVEMTKLSLESSKSMLGFMMTFLQLPILYALYSVFTKMPMSASSGMMPWLSNLNLPDPYFIIPALTVLAQLMPSLLVTMGVLKTWSIPKISIVQVLISCVMACVVFAKAPVALGLYWVVSGTYTSLEQVAYAMMKSKKPRLNH